MKLRLLTSSLLFVLSFGVFADDSLYCPQNHQYIRIGMTIDQVIAACGQPLARQESNQPLMQKVPVQQLIYNNQRTGTAFGNWNPPPTGSTEDGTAFYGVWNMPTGGGGTPLQVNVINNIVRGISVNGSETKAFSICNGSNVQVGDNVSKVYGACGSPDVVNNSFVMQPIETQTEPVIWIYQPDPYQPSLSLTFVDGKLQSINN